MCWNYEASAINQANHNYIMNISSSAKKTTNANIIYTSYQDKLYKFTQVYFHKT